MYETDNGRSFDKPITTIYRTTSDEIVDLSKF